MPQGQEQDRTFGIEIGSNGTGPSRVDHNCLRGNTWAIANQRYAASSVRIDHNDAFRHGFVTYEIGSPVAGTSNARVDHNRSVSVGFYAFLVEGSDHVRLDNNVAEDSSSSAFRIHGSSAVRVDHNAANGGIGVGVLSGNTDVRISENQLTGGTTGIGVAGSATGPIPNPSTRVVATSNTVHGYTMGILLALNANNSDTVITKNVVRENRLGGHPDRADQHRGLIAGQPQRPNGMFGIRTVPGVTGNSIVANSMHGNGKDTKEGTTPSRARCIPTARSPTPGPATCATPTPRGRHLHRSLTVGGSCNPLARHLVWWDHARVAVYRSEVLVGRDAELEELRATAKGAARGEPGVVLMLGEAGVGKSRLVAEATAELEAAGALFCRQPRGRAFR